jgi:hypothetical protein
MNERGSLRHVAAELGFAIPAKNCQGWYISRHHLGAHLCHVRPVSSHCYKP